MIDYLDNLLHRLFRNSIAELTSDAQVRFQPPDDDWRALVPTITDAAGSPANVLNVYLADLRENRRLRSNARERTVVGQEVFEAPPARRVDCHYLISAWSPVALSIAIDPTPDEHALLAEVARTLGAYDDLDATSIYAASTPPSAPPAVLAGERFPITLLPVEGFTKIAEFWGTMGSANRLKPVVYAVITVALKEAPVRAGPIVTTTVTRTLFIDAPETASARYQIGGSVFDGAIPPQGVPLAWVELLTPASERHRFTRADMLGRFVFSDVAAGPWQLRASATPFGVSAPREVVVPEPSGSYDVAF